MKGMERENRKIKTKLYFPWICATEIWDLEKGSPLISFFFPPTSGPGKGL